MERDFKRRTTNGRRENITRRGGPHQSGRPKPRDGSLGPNGVANKFLASLIGREIEAIFPDHGKSFTGILRKFDSYSFVISPEKGHDTLIFKGPRLVIMPR